MTVSLPSHATQNSCCYRSALDHATGFCGDCGKPLFRCMAFEECGGLLDEQGRCNVCVAPAIELDANAIRGVQMGGVLSLPLIIRNSSRVGRPLFITSLMARKSGGEYALVDLTWERLNPDSEARVGVPTGILEEAGIHQFDFLINVATRYRWREEVYAFETSVTAEVEVAASTVVNQQINIEGDMAPGFTFYNPTKVAGTKSTKWDRMDGPMPLPLQRAEKHERETNLRGISARAWVPRATCFIWKGFGEAGAPIDGPAVTADGVIALGRTRTKLAGGAGDARLLVYGKDGVLDRDASQAISRHHFDLYIENNRLMLRVNSENGLRINGDAFGRGKVAQLEDGDVIAPLVEASAQLAINIQFEINHGRVDTVTLTRSPAALSGRIS